MRLAFLGATFVIMLLNASAGARERSWIAHGPGGGSVAVLETDPQRPSVLYAGTSAGLYKSTDAGKSWVRRSVGLPPDTVVFLLELAPSAPSTLYLGGSSGLFRSTNGGRTWEKVNVPDTTYIDDLEVDPRLASRVYLAAWEGLFRSDDGGLSWRNFAPGVHDFVTVAPSAPKVIYTEGSGGLQRSIDAGATWSGLRTPFVGAVDGFTVDPRDPDTIYFGKVNLYKSTDGGANPRLVFKTPGQSISAIAIDPRNPRRLFAAGLDEVFSSTDGATSWRRLSKGLPRGDQLSDLEVAPAVGGAAYVSFISHGVYKTTRDGKRWRFSSNGLAASWVRSLAVDALSPATVYAGLDEAGVARSTDGGLRWSPRRLPLFHAFAVATAGHVAYAAGKFGAYRSKDRGVTWRRVWRSRDNTMLSLASAPSAAKVVYGGTVTGHIYRSVNGGTTWRAVVRLPNTTVQALAVHPTRPNVLWAAGGTHVFRTVNAGRTWKQSPGIGFVEALAVAPLNPRVLYASAYSQAPYPGGGVYRSGDGGLSWKRASTGIDTTAMFAVAIDRRHPRTLFAGGCDENRHGGVYRTTNGARSWVKISAGMARTCVSSLALTPSGSTLHIGTVGGGVFTKRVR